MPVFEKYECIKTNKSESSVEKMCEILKVSRSGYYSYLNRPESRRTKKNKRILEILINAHIKDPVAGLDSLWVGDITYNWTDEGWIYTAIVKYLCTKDVVGYAIGDRITKELAIKAMNMAISRERPKPGLIFHSDRGSQYCSNTYQDLLIRNKITPSMSRKGNPYDNAVAENFFSNMKCECTNFYSFRTRAEAKQTIFEYIEIYYNRQRRHSGCG